MKIDFHSEEAKTARKFFIFSGRFDEMEFREAFSHIFILKKKINKFIEKGEINERLLLNETIYLFNCFDSEFLKARFTKRYTDLQLGVVKSLLKFLGYIDEHDPLYANSNRLVDHVLNDVRERYGLPKAYRKP